MDIKTLSGLLIVKLPLSMRQLIVGAIITESLNTKPILLPILFSVASAHFFTLPALSFPSIIAISEKETVSRLTTSKSFAVTIPSFPIKSTCKCNLLKIRYGFFQGNQLIGINIPIIKLLNFVFCKYSKICELWVQIIGKLR